MSRLLALLFLLCFIPSTFADVAWPVGRGPSREPSSYVYDPKSIAKVPRDFIDDSVATLLYAGSTYLVDPDGTIETITHDVTRLNGRKGVEKLGEFRSVTYTPSYQKLTLNVARIHKADGTIVEVQPRHVHLRDVATDYQVYDPEKQLIISFPGLEVGDTTEVKWTVRGKNPEHDGQFFARYSFGDIQYPIVLDELRVQVPKSMPLTYAWINEEVLPEIKHLKKDRLYLWKTTNRDKLPRDENLPSKEELRPVVAVSTFTSWEQIGQWKHKLRQECWKPTPKLKALVAEITKGLKTPTEKARALTYWVRRNLRYQSAGERHDYTPHLPDKVLANRYGDCKDTSQLLAVMLRQIGVSVELATLGVRDDGQVHEKVPSPWGTHAILLATIDGKEHWIDTTTSIAAWDVLPRDDMDRLTYLTDDKGKLRLKRTPALTANRNRAEQLTEVWVDDEGNSHCRRKVWSFDYAAMTPRDTYLEVPPGERRRLLTAELQDSNSRSRLLSLKIDEKALRDFDKPVILDMNFEIMRHFSGSPEREGSFTDSKVWGKLLAYNIDPDRKTPMVLPAPFESMHIWRFSVPTAFQFEGVPRRREIKSAWGSFLLEPRAIDGDGMRQVEVRFHTILEKTRVEVSELEEFRKFHEEVGRYYRAWLTMRPVSDLASAADLQRLLLVMPQNTFAATTLAKIYLKNGKLEQARFVLDQAIFYAPHEVELRELRVQAAEDPADEEKLHRELVKRQPESRPAALALAATLITRGKHDEARAMLEPMTKRGSGPDRAKAFYQLSRSYYRKDELNKALEALDEATKEDSATTATIKTRMLRGQILDELKRPKDAIEAFQSVLNLDANHTEALLSLIRLHMILKEELPTLNYLRQYVLLVSKDRSALLLAAEAYYRLRRFDEALELALRSRELGFQEKTQRLLGLIYLARKEYAKAVVHLDKAEADEMVLSGLIEASLGMGTLREMEKILDRVARLEKRSAKLERLVARVRQLLQRRAELPKLTKVPAEKEDLAVSVFDALVCAEEAVRQGRDAVGLIEPIRKSGLEIGAFHALLARLALEQGKLSQAAREAEQAIKISPKEAWGWYVRGRVRGEREQAGELEDLQKAAELSQRKDVEVLVSLAECQARKKQWEQATTTAREALKLRPEDEALASLVQRLAERK